MGGALVVLTPARSLSVTCARFESVVTRRRSSNEDAGEDEEEELSIALRPYQDNDEGEHLLRHSPSSPSSRGAGQQHRQQQQHRPAVTLRVFTSFNLFQLLQGLGLLGDTFALTSAS